MDAIYVDTKHNFFTSFNPRARDGRDYLLAILKSYRLFQSTRP